MKKLLILLIALLSINVSRANDTLSKSLFFVPQEIQINEQQEGLNTNDFTLVESFIEQSILQQAKGDWQIVSEQNSVLHFSFQIDSSLKHHDEYKLIIDASKISIAAKNKRALFYGKQSLLTLLDIYKEKNTAVPQITSSDWADFERRGYMLDVSRDKVPTMQSLYMLIDQLAELRINELQLYIEHTFAYKNHKVVWENSSPLTAEEILQLNAYCVQKGIDLVPNQNSFGHMENWLKHDEYLDLCECESDCKTVWGKRKRTSLAPNNPKSFELMQELYAELLPNFSSEYFNIGCDETVELGLGKSKDLCDSLGKGQVYLDYLKKLNTEVQKHNRKAQFWGDIILNHPELIKDIPSDMIALDWGYSATYPFEKNLPKFQQSGLEYYVCPGTSTWRSEIGRNHNAFENLKNAAIQGKKFKAKGYLITDWGDYGHFQPKAVSYAPIVLGANYAWHYTPDNIGNLAGYLNTKIFKDSTGYTAKALLVLGDAYLKAKIPNGNANAFHLMIRRYAWTMQGHWQTKHLTKAALLEAEKEINKGLALLKQAKPGSEDAATILKETKQAARLALFGIHLGLARLEAKKMATNHIPKAKREALANELSALIESHKSIWIIRNRKGGLSDSAGKLQDLLNYLQKD